MNEDSYGFGSTRTKVIRRQAFLFRRWLMLTWVELAAGQPKLAVVGLRGLIKQSSRSSAGWKPTNVDTDADLL